MSASMMSLDDESTIRIDDSVPTSRVERRSRIPVELQAVFLLSGRGETVDQPPPEKM
jgi:hypothetical protein